MGCFKQSTWYQKIEEKGNWKVVGLFKRSYMSYVDERPKTEPSLTDMATTAWSLLQKTNNKGFFLMVEGGKIDKAHHQNWGLRSIREMKEFDDTVRAVYEQLTAKEQKETLIIVTADHGHTFTFGYPGTKRGAAVHKPVGGSSSQCENIPTAAASNCSQQTHTISGYYSGPNGKEFVDETGKVSNEIAKDTLENAAFEYRMKSASEVTQASHSGEDVPIYARGPMSHMFTGVNEQAYIGQAMKFATCVGQFKEWTDKDCKKAKAVRHCVLDKKIWKTLESVLKRDKM